MANCTQVKKSIEEALRLDEEETIMAGITQVRRSMIEACGGRVAVSVSAAAQILGVSKRYVEGLMEGKPYFPTQGGGQKRWHVHDLAEAYVAAQDAAEFRRKNAARK